LGQFATTNNFALPFPCFDVATEMDLLNKELVAFYENEAAQLALNGIDVASFKVRCGVL